MSRTLPLVAVFLIACGGSTPPPEEIEPEASSGGEAESDAPRSSLSATVPVQVPEPAVARANLSESVQALWTAVEQTVAIEAPEPPAEPTVDEANAWVQGSLVDWIGARAQALREAIQLSESITDDPAFDRAVAATLIGYAIEHLVAGVRTALVPEVIAVDPELLEVYQRQMSDLVRPLAIQGVTYYAFCERRLAEDAGWSSWREYCAQRGQDMRDTYEVEAP